jgi:hypothetical protein
MFSVAGDICTRKRSALRHFRVAALLFIKQNAHLFPGYSYKLASTAEVDKFYQTGKWDGRFIAEQLESDSDNEEDDEDMPDDAYFVCDDED